MPAFSNRCKVTRHRAPARTRSYANPAVALSAGALLTALAFAPPALAGATLKISDDASINVGLGLRASYTGLENGAPNGSSNFNSFQVENARLYTSGEFGKIFKATMNFNASGNVGSAAGTGDSLRMIDGIARFEFMPEANIWLGRMLPPSDRANLYGPFFTVGWSFPFVGQAYPASTAGRDTGVMIWGDPLDGKMSYSFGIFNGHNRAAGASNASNNVLYAGRIEGNFWDAQKGYYRDGTYYGSKDILSVGLAGFSQSNGVGSAAAPGSLHIWSLDGIYEQKLSGGYVPTVELIRYKYGLGTLDCGSGEPGAPACPAGENIGGQVAGTAYIATGAFLFPSTVGYGKFQPFVRYQRYFRDISQTTSKASEFGLNYLINGFNAKISAVFTRFNDDRTGAPTVAVSAKQFVLGVQLQY